MHMNKTKFERNSSLGYYHMACIVNKTYQLKSKRSISHIYSVALCRAWLDISTNNLMCVRGMVDFVTTLTSLYIGQI